MGDCENLSSVFKLTCLGLFCWVVGGLLGALGSEGVVFLLLKHDLKSEIYFSSSFRQKSSL